MSYDYLAKRQFALKLLTKYGKDFVVGRESTADLLTPHIPAGAPVEVTIKGVKVDPSTLGRKMGERASTDDHVVRLESEYFFEARAGVDLLKFNYVIDNGVKKKFFKVDVLDPAGVALLYFGLTAL